MLEWGHTLLWHLSESKVSARALAVREINWVKVDNMLEVSGAILVNNGEILCAQRNKGKYEYVSYKYEFPGGKIEQGETAAEALHRELIEEMEVDIPIDSMKHFYTVEHTYPDFNIRMHCYICNMKERRIVLKEHVNAVWKSLQSIGELDWAAADRPVVEALIKRGEI